MNGGVAIGLRRHSPGITIAQGIGATHRAVTGGHPAAGIMALCANAPVATVETTTTMAIAANTVTKEITATIKAKGTETDMANITGKQLHR